MAANKFNGGKFRLMNDCYHIHRMISFDKLRVMVLLRYLNKQSTTFQHPDMYGVCETQQNSCIFVLPHPLIADGALSHEFDNTVLVKCAVTKIRSEQSL